MEPLSPRAVNIPSKSRAAAKDYAKPSANKEPPKAKEHAIKPPPIIVQPPVQEGLLSDKYRIGNHLGKGGFAVCYEGELQCKKYKTADRIYALKVVPATMNHKKMEDKVPMDKETTEIHLLTQSEVPNRAPDTCETASPEHCRIPSRIHVQRQHICRPRAVPKWIGHGRGEEARMLKLARGSALNCSTVWGCQVHALQECDTPRLEDGQPVS